MILYFENSDGEWRPIADCKDKIEVGIAIKRFLDEHHYKAPYTRIWEKNGWRHYDCGSWTEFFHWQISSDAVVPSKVKGEEHE